MDLFDFADKGYQEPPKKALKEGKQPKSGYNGLKVGDYINVTFQSGEQFPGIIRDFRKHTIANEENDVIVCNGFDILLPLYGKVKIDIISKEDYDCLIKKKD